MSGKPKLTTTNDAPVGDNQNVMTAGARGPMLLQDIWLLEKLAHFDREVIPERRMHAKGFGAKLFSEVGMKTELFLRFSTVAGERGAADVEWDIHGFAMKFYTEEGNWDMVGKDRESHQKDLYKSIEKGSYPRWDFKIQIMPEQDAGNYRFHPFDLTKVWSHKDGNYGSTKGYEPNSLGEWQEQPEANEPPLSLDGAADHWNHRDDDYYTQPGDLFRLMTLEQQQMLFDNTARSVGGADIKVQKRHVVNCLKADRGYGEGVAKNAGYPARSLSGNRRRSEGELFCTQRA